MVYEAQELIGKAVQLLAKLKAIDSIEAAEFPASERNKIIATLINPSKIKEILFNQHNIAENESAYNGEIVVPATKRFSIRTEQQIRAHDLNL